MPKYQVILCGHAGHTKVSNYIKFDQIKNFPSYLTAKLYENNCNKLNEVEKEGKTLAMHRWSNIILLVLHTNLSNCHSIMFHILADFSAPRRSSACKIDLNLSVLIIIVILSPLPLNMRPSEIKCFTGAFQCFIITAQIMGLGWGTSVWKTSPSLPKFLNYYRIYPEIDLRLRSSCLLIPPWRLQAWRWLFTSILCLLATNEIHSNWVKAYC